MRVDVMVSPCSAGNLTRQDGGEFPSSPVCPQAPRNLSAPPPPVEDTLTPAVPPSFQEEILPHMQRPKTPPPERLPNEFGQHEESDGSVSEEEGGMQREPTTYMGSYPFPAKNLFKTK